MADEASSEWMHSYREQGKHVLGNGEATISISRNGQGKTVYEISTHIPNGTLTSSVGDGNFIKDSKRSFIFAENAESYWIFDGATTVVRTTFQEHGIKAESFTVHSRDCLSASIAAAPEAFLGQLPSDVQEAIRKARRA